MGHISYFSGLSNYSLQAGNWHPSPSMYVLLLDPEPSGMGGSLDPTDLGSGLLPRPGCPPPPHPTLHPPAIRSVPWIIPPRASFLVLGVPTPAIHSVPPSPPQIVPHRGCRPHPKGCSLLSVSLEFSQWKDILSHSRCQPRGQQNFGSWTHGTHFLLTSDEDAWSQWRWYRHHLLTPSLVQTFSSAELWILHQDLSF